MGARKCMGCHDMQGVSEEEAAAMRTLQPSIAIPSEAWRRNFWANPPRRRKPLKPTVMQTIPLMPLGFRMWRRVGEEKSAVGEAFMDPFHDWAHDTSHGVPLGGIGCGAMGRGWRGDFRRYSTAKTPSGLAYISDATPHSCFTVCVANQGKSATGCTLLPAPSGRPSKEVRYLPRTATAESRCLYPRAWQVYETPTESAVHDYIMTCEQVSPVIPHDYAESCLPCGVFEWTIENKGDESLDVAIMFSLHNGTTSAGQRTAGPHSQPFPDKASVHMQHNLGGDAGSFCIAAEGGLSDTYRSDEATTAACEEWPADAFGSLWKEFVSRRGALPPARPRGANGALSCVSSKVTVAPKSQKKVRFSLAWDFPVVRFGASQKTYSLKYAERFGSDGRASVTLAQHALQSCDAWRTSIQQWQSKVLDDPSLPDWYKGQLFNESYFLTAGGSLWTSDGGVTTEDGQEVSDPVGHWLYLEGMEYRMSVSYDVHFYASFALACLFPLLEKSLTLDVARTISRQWSDTRTYLHSGASGMRKARGTLPHDLGGPTEDPWQRPNVYCIHETSRWKDLPLKFVLMVYRNYIALGRDAKFLRDLWGDMQCVVNLSATSFDTDGRGMIINEPWPDQTYDAWKAQGVTAYCGGLWLAALRVMEHTAKILGDEATSSQYAQKLVRAQGVYAELWNPAGYYNYDSSRSSHSDSIMADQCCGEWYILACGLPSVLPPNRARSALETVFRLNVKKFGRLAHQADKGLQLRGAVNGMRPDGSLDKCSLQSMECWTGTTFAVASHMLMEGMREEAFYTAQGLHEGAFQQFGFWFNTPEAWLADGSFRSLGYMRPLCVWAMQWALDMPATAAPPQEGSDAPRPQEAVPSDA